jgi:hypothetical protein
MRDPADRRTRRGTSLVVAFLVASCLQSSSIQPASAGPRAPHFGPVIEDYSGYVSPERCRPAPKPGVQAFADLLLETYRDSTWVGISRACHGEPTSDHQEGRAIDWGRSATVRSERAEVEDLLDWLFATDRYGNTDAMIRRLGITYLIWNRDIWGAWSGDWEVYCVQKPAGCRDPDSRSIMDPHTSHIHISFGWPGARMQTSFWDPAKSFA